MSNKDVVDGILNTMDGTLEFPRKAVAELLTSMDDRVKKLAGLQAELVAEKKYADEDGIVITLREAVADRKKDLEASEAALAFELESTNAVCETIISSIDRTKAEILDAWDGEHKTVEFPSGVLKFRTTHRLEIRDGAALLATLLDHFTTNQITDTYISRFNKTNVKKFMGIIPTIPDVAEIVDSTSVALTATEEA